MSKRFFEISAILALATITILLVDAKQYRLVYEKKTWADAREECRNSKGFLASITSRDENKAALRVVALAGISSEPVWVGGSDHIKEGTFVWDASGEEFTYVDWGKDPKLPNNKYNTHCVGLFEENDAYYSWHDAVCSEERYFLCEI